MAHVFTISDTHFDQVSMLTFVNSDGSKVRPFTTVEEMDETMVDNWNRIVKRDDKVYHLGDVSMTKKGLEILSRLNGTKVLIKGNHDIYRLKDYTPYFKDIRACHKLDNFILSHIPIHRDSLINRWCEGNIHGHYHSREVLLDGKPDPMYFNVSVERINYTPIAIEEVFRRMRK
jgi:calcineurin-like phosphoesterase family protein